MREDRPTPGEVTRLLALARAGEADAVDRLFPLVYDELRRIARSRVRRSPGAETIQATGLVHEAYLKLAGSSAIAAQDRAHFLAIAGRAMRQVLVDRARARSSNKRGGGWSPVTLGDGDVVVELDPLGMLALHRAIEDLDPRQREVAEARFFGGLEEREIAAVLGISERTVRREWVKARAWLVRALAPAAAGGAGGGVAEGGGGVAEGGGA